MKTKKYLFDGSNKCQLNDIPTNSKEDDVDKESILAETEKNLEKIAILQDIFYADKREGLIVVLQALDAAGKDSTIKNVMSCMNPQGVTVHSFKQPTTEDLTHDYLWRVNRCLPERGKIAIFNRSYYEDVLVVQVHNLQKNYSMAERIISQSEKKFFEKRYQQISNYEDYLYENSYRVVKIFLHVSHDKQKERFLERIDKPEKNWKFSSADLKERAMFNEYTEIYNTVISKTSSTHCPWYAIPADQKWYTRYLVSQILLNELEQCKSKYPKLSDEAESGLMECRRQLVNEK